MASNTPLEGAQEIQGMLVNYAKQETVEPLKRLGRYLGLGLAGSLFIFLGVLFIGLGALRFTQSIDTFEGTSSQSASSEQPSLGWMSTIPYLVTVVVLMSAIGLIYLSLNRAKRRVVASST